MMMVKTKNKKEKKLPRCIFENMARNCCHKVHAVGKKKMKCVKKGCPYYRVLGDEDEIC